MIPQGINNCVNRTEMYVHSVLNTQTHPYTLRRSFRVLTTFIHIVLPREFLHLRFK
jgi:hypothetical protein